MKNIISLFLLTCFWAGLSTQIVTAQEAPARCADLAAQAPSGLYVFDIQGQGPMQTFCDNDITADGRRGGWMMVWSNLRGGGNDPATDLSWWTSIHTPPRIHGVLPLSDGTQTRQFFEIFTGLDWWVKLAGADSEAEMIYEWASDYSKQRRIDQQAFCAFRLEPSDSYRIFFDAASCRQTKGSAGLPGLFVTHTGGKWSAMDVDNDKHEKPCSHFYSRVPFWFQACWSGSINGGGEAYGSGHINGAYWIKADAQFAKSQPSTTAIGAGNGWMYIRPKGSGH